MLFADATHNGQRVIIVITIIFCLVHAMFTQKAICLPLFLKLAPIDQPLRLVVSTIMQLHA
jgi:hypothetical protein